MGMDKTGWWAIIQNFKGRINNMSTHNPINKKNIKLDVCKYHMGINPTDSILSIWQFNFSTNPF